MGCAIGIRFLICFMVFLAILLDSAIRSAMSMTILTMVNNTHSVNQSFLGRSSHQLEETFDWDPQIQSYVLNSVYVGILLSLLPASHIAESSSIKWVFGYGMFSMSLLTIVGPVLASLNVWLFIASRVLGGLAVGVTVPSGTALITRWSPLQEKTMLISLAYQGYVIGPTISLFTAGPICKYLGWEFMFYAFGSAGVLWSIVWYFVVTSSPEKHKWISAEEKEFIVSSRTGNFDHNKKVPWLSILCSQAVWILCFRTICSAVMYAIYFTYVPMFLFHNFKVDLTTTGFVNGVSNLFTSVVATSSSIFADYLLANNFSINQVRKTFATLSMTLPAIMFLAIIQFENSFRMVALMIFAMSCVWGLYGGSDSALAIDIGAEYSGAICGLMNVFSNLANVLTPVVVGWYLESKEDVQHWNVIFAFGSITSIVGAFVFLIFGTAETQSWTGPDEDVSPLVESD